MQLSGTGTGDPRWLEKIVKHPPSSLSTLEYWVGSLAVDFAGHEGMGFVVRPSTPPRGSLRREIRHVGARFWVDLHHEDPHRVRDMRLSNVSLAIDIGHATVAKLLEAAHGPGRPVVSEHGPVVEYGAWFYLSAAHDGAAFLAYETQQPEWAIPPAPRGAHETLLHTLHDRLICDDTLDAIFAALRAPAEAAGAELHDWNRRNGRIDLAFRPGLPLADVVAAMHWENPVSSSGDVHMSSWSVYPHRPALPFWAPHIKDWFVDVRLDGWPRGEGGADLPRIGNAGPSPLIDVRACVNKVIGISIRKEQG